MCLQVTQGVGGVEGDEDNGEWEEEDNGAMGGGREAMTGTLRKTLKLTGLFQHVDGMHKGQGSFLGGEDCG